MKVIKILSAVPWGEISVIVQSFLCIVFMTLDFGQGLIKRVFWFPSRFFLLQPYISSLVLGSMAISLNIQPDQILENPPQTIGALFMFTMFANFLPSFALLDEEQLFRNLLAFILPVILIISNIFHKCYVSEIYPYQMLDAFLVLYIFLRLCPILLIIPSIRKKLKLQYKDIRKLPPTPLIDISSIEKELEFNIRKNWIMAQTGHPQFYIACSKANTVSALISVSALYKYRHLFTNFISMLEFQKSWFDIFDFFNVWSLIMTFQIFGILIGSMALVCRSFYSILYSSLSKKWIIDHLNPFKIDNLWFIMLRSGKRRHIQTYIRRARVNKTLHLCKSFILELAIVLDSLIIIIDGLIFIFPCLLCILLRLCYEYLLRYFQAKGINSCSAISDVEVDAYTVYVVHMEPHAKLSHRPTRNALVYINDIIDKAVNMEPKNLLMLLDRSSGIDRITNFVTDPILHIPNTWSLVVVTMAALGVAVPDVTEEKIKLLLDGVSEGLEMVYQVEECLNTNTDLMLATKVSKDLWNDVESHRKWKEFDLRGDVRRSFAEIVDELIDGSKRVVEKMVKRGTIDDRERKRLIAYDCIFKTSKLINERYVPLGDWPSDNELFELISISIANVLFACFTNLARVIEMKCNEEQIEKLEGSVLDAAKLLGHSKKIIKKLEDWGVPRLDLEARFLSDT